MRSVLLLAGLATLAACGQEKHDTVDLPLKPSDAATMPAPPPPDPAQASPVAVVTPAPIAATSAAPTPKSTPSPKPSPAAPEKHFRAVGTEPFWNVDVLPKARLKYATPEMINGVIVSAVEQRQGNVVRYVARFNRKPFVLEIKPGKCSDGMSDLVYPYEVRFTRSGRTDRGCARLK